MGDALTVDGRGQRLTALQVVAEPVRDVVDEVAWELPGGTIEAGETPRAAATRELSEETGIQLHELDFVWRGLATFELVSPDRTEHAAVFSVELPSPRALTTSDELIALRWHALDDAIADVSPLDLMVARLFCSAHTT